MGQHTAKYLTDLPDAARYLARFKFTFGRHGSTELTFDARPTFDAVASNAADNIYAPVAIVVSSQWLATMPRDLSVRVTRIKAKPRRYADKAATSARPPRITVDHSVAFNARRPLVAAYRKTRVASSAGDG